MSWLSVAVGVAANSAEGASALSALAIILPYLSSGFVPTEPLPKVLGGFARYQPMTPIIDTMRNALLGRPLETGTLGLAAAWCAGLAAVFYFMALRMFYRKMER